MITATFISESAPNGNHRGHRKHYRLSEPVPCGWDEDETTDYVIASAVIVDFEGGRPETYLFPANEQGEITSWTEMPGSLKDTLRHEDAIAAAGWVPA